MQTMCWMTLLMSPLLTVDELTDKDDLTSSRLGYNKFMIMSVWEAGRKRLEKDNVKKMRVDALARTAHKKDINHAILSRIKENNNGEIDLNEEVDVEIPACTQHVNVMDLFPYLYED